MTTPANSPKSADHGVEIADANDMDVLARVIADAFHGLAVSQWLVPDPLPRRAIFPSYFRIYVERALDDGLVLTTPARDVAALWIPVGTDGPGEPPEEYHDELAILTGRHLARFQALDAAFDRHHPVGTAHEHLAILAVRPDRQRLGIGTAVLHARHAILDRDGIPAYLEASDPAKRDIYLKHGYVLRPDAPIRLPDTGPELYPMWREPRGAGLPGSTRSPDLRTGQEPAGGGNTMTHSSAGCPPPFKRPAAQRSRRTGGGPQVSTSTPTAPST